MIGLDTNVLVRYLVQDDPRQCERIDRLFEAGLDGDREFFVSSVVLCELVWVLESAYGFARTEVVTALDGILHTRQLEIEQSARVRQALVGYAEGRGDFSDCLIGLTAADAGCSATVTFDRGLRRNDAFTVLQK